MTGLNYHNTKKVMGQINIIDNLKIKLTHDEKNKDQFYNLPFKSIMWLQNRL